MAAAWVAAPLAIPPLANEMLDAPLSRDWIILAKRSPSSESSCAEKDFRPPKISLNFLMTEVAVNRATKSEIRLVRVTPMMIVEFAWLAVFSAAS